MKQYWSRLSGWIDARNLRERGLIFAALVAILVMAANSLFLSPLVRQETQLSKQMLQDRAATRKLQTSIQEMAAVPVIDPNARNQARLKQLDQDVQVAEAAVRDLQKGLVSPDRMVSVLQNILNRQGKLHWVSLTKLPLQSLVTDPKPADSKLASQSAIAAGDTKNIATPAAGPANSIYKHGVEIVLQGGYMDMMAYMAELEKLSGQVFWGKVKLHVDEYPKATLTMDLFTLSLEKKWLNI